MSTTLIFFSDISDTHKSLDVTVEGIWVEMMRTQHFTSCFPVSPSSKHSFLLSNIHVKFPVFKVDKLLLNRKALEDSTAYKTVLNIILKLHYNLFSLQIATACFCSFSNQYYY